MNEKELREIKRRFRPDKTNIPCIKGCFVNENGQIVSKINQSILLSGMDESERLLKVMKRTLSGTLGTNLTDIEFSTKQVTDSEEHKLLMSLRNTNLSDEAVLDRFYSKVIETVHLDSGYVILLANDIYDVYTRDKDGEGESSTVFSYVVCSICPVKNSPEALCFRESDSLFHSVGVSALLCNPELGFMFPCFNDRVSNIYHALYYTRNVVDNYPDFIQRVFGSSAPLPPKRQKIAFDSCIRETLGDDCNLNTVSSVHKQIAEMIEEHKEAKVDEPLTVSKATIRNVLESCGIEEEKIEKFGKEFDESFGANAEISPKNILDVKKFELTTPNVTIKVNPDSRDLVSTQLIGGVKYIMIKATDGVEVNGINIEIE